MPIGSTFIGIAFLSQFQIGNIFQLQYFAIVRRADYNFAKLFGSNQTPFILHGILVSFIGVLTERSGSRLNVLFGKYGGHITRNEFVLRHHIGLHPYTQAIFATHNHHITYSGDTENFRFQVDTDIVGKKSFIVRIVRTEQREHLQDTGLPLGSSNSHLGHFRRKLACSLGNTILYVYCRHVRVGTLFEINSNGNRTGIGGRRGHVSHIFHTINYFFQRRNHTLLQSLCAGTKITGTHHNGGRSNIGILFDGQREQSDDPDNDNRYRDDSR